jgi:hypothetical protein
LAAYKILSALIASLRLHPDRVLFAWSWILAASNTVFRAIHCDRLASNDLEPPFHERLTGIPKSAAWLSI